MNVESYDCRLDWLTFSSPKDAQAARDFRNFGRDLLNRAQGTETLRTRAYQRGYAGESVAGLSLVTRAQDGHSLLIGQGIDADALAAEVLNAGINGTATRCDVAATFKLSESNPGAARSYYEAIRAKERAQGRARRASMGFFEGTRADTGFTCGARSGAVCVRFYDWAAKHTASTNHDIWRFEIELKNGGQSQFWERYRERVDKRDLCRAVVAEKMHRLGIEEPCIMTGERFAVVGTKAVTTNEKRLIYLDKVVCPMISKLVDAGFEDELKALFARHGLTILENA